MDMKPVLGSLSLLILFLLVLHSLWQWSRRFPPAVDRAPSGVEGGLMFVVGLIAAALLFNATAFGLMVAAVVSGLSEGGTAFWMSTGAAGIMSFAGFLWAMLRLLSGRTRTVRWEAALGVLLSGPVAEGWMLAVGTGEPERATVMTVGALFATAYVVLSSRARNTYGA